MILLDALPEATVEFVQYGTKEHKELEATPNTIFCDFSPPRERVDEFLAAETIVLDHHKGAPVERFVEAGLGDFVPETPGVSGASLAYADVWVPLRNPNDTPNFFTRLAVLAATYDTWQTDSQDWDEACDVAECLRFWPWSYIEDKVKKSSFFGSSPPPQTLTWEDLFEVGPHLSKLSDVDSVTLSKNAFRVTSKRERKVAIVPTTGAKLNKVAHHDQGNADLVIGFSYNIEPDSVKQICSCRTKTDFDCHAFALAMGGGGHTKAAGFSIPVDVTHKDPITVIRRMLGLYEEVEDLWKAKIKEPHFTENYPRPQQAFAHLLLVQIPGLRNAPEVLKLFFPEGTPDPSHQNK
jgi:hypothetical protein